MSMYGTNFFYATLQCLTLIFFFAWPVLSLVALFGLRVRKLDQVAQALWVLVVISIPILGALAMWILQPGDAIPSPAQPVSRKTEKEAPPAE